MNTRALMMSPKPLQERSANDLMERTIVFFKKESPCDAILSALVNWNFGSVPIVDEKMEVIGIVSEDDLLDAILAGADLRHLLAGEIMSDPDAVSIDASAMEIARFLQQHHLIRVPVVDREKRLVGIVARRDLLAGYLEMLLEPCEAFY